MRCIAYILILSVVFACSSQGKLQEMEPFQSEKSVGGGESAYA